MRFFKTGHKAGVGEFISGVTGSTGDYDLTLQDGTVFEEYDETANTYGVAAPAKGDLCLFGSAGGDAIGRKPSHGDIVVIPALEASRWFPQVDSLAPSIVALSPADEATGVVATVDLTQTLGKAGLSIESQALITLTDGAGTPLDEPGTFSISGAVGTFAPTGASMNTGEVYTMAFAAGALSDVYGNLSEAYSYTFTIA